MSTDHRGEEGKAKLDEIIRRFVAQGEGKAKRAYPEGRMGPNDEGELAFAVGVNQESGTVVINFNKPVHWVGMGPADAVRLAEMLIGKARALGHRVELTI